MDNVSFITQTDPNGIEMEYAIIDRGNGEFTSMLKSTYEAQQAALSTPIATLASKLSNPSTPQAGE